MKLQHISYDLAAVVAAQVKTGKTLHQIARSMHISVDTAAGALSRWSLLQRASARRPS